MCIWDALNVNGKWKRMFSINQTNVRIAKVGKTSRKDGCEVLRYGRSCSKMRWTILRIGPWESGATLQSFSSFLDDHKLKEELENVGKFSDKCSQIVLKCLYLARTGRLDILWSVSKLAWAVAKTDRACDKRLARWISCIHHTNEFSDNILGFFQDFCSVWDLEDSKSTSGGVLCIWKSNIWEEKNEISGGREKKKAKFLAVQRRGVPGEGQSGGGDGPRERGPKILRTPTKNFEDTPKSTKNLEDTHQKILNTQHTQHTTHTHG